MAACTTTIMSTVTKRAAAAGARVAERNAELMALQPLRRRGVRTPEFFFAKRFDNSRLVKAPDPVRARQMRIVFRGHRRPLLLVMVYGLQHF